MQKTIRPIFIVVVVLFNAKLNKREIHAKKHMQKRLVFIFLFFLNEKKKQYKTFGFFQREIPQIKRLNRSNK